MSNILSITIKETRVNLDSYNIGHNYGIPQRPSNPELIIQFDGTEIIFVGNTFIIDKIMEFVDVINNGSNIELLMASKNANYLGNCYIQSMSSMSIHRVKLYSELKELFELNMLVVGHGNMRKAEVDISTVLSLFAKEVLREKTVKKIYPNISSENLDPEFGNIVNENFFGLT